MEYNKNKAKGYTLPYDTPYQQHMKKVKDITSTVSHALPAQILLLSKQKVQCCIQWFVMSFTMQLKYREVYEKSKAQINIDPEAHEIRAAKEAYKNITNVSVWNCQIKKKKFFFSLWISDILDIMLFFLVSAWLQEEIWGYQEQVDLDIRQTRLPQRC